MRKLHWNNGKHVACRPRSATQEVRQLASTVKEITCIPCLKAVGLSKVAMKISAAKAKVTLLLPNRKSAVCLAESFEMHVEAAPMIEEKDVAQFLGHEPEPIAFKVRLTEDGYAALKVAMLGK